MPKILLERSATPIYQRIIQSFQDSLEKYENQVILADPSEFFDADKAGINLGAYVDFINQQNIDYVLITNLASTLVSYLPELQKFLFQFLESPMIFIHHDSLFSSYDYDKNKIVAMLRSLYLVRNRSFHFCLEYYNFLDLKSLGIEHTYLINHASEFTRIDLPKNYRYDLSFVGHLLPYNHDELETIHLSHLFIADFWNRINDLDTSLEKKAIKFASLIQKKQDSDWSQTIELLGNKYFYLSLLHGFSQFFRGELIKRIDPRYSVDIIGGDPDYMRGSELNRKIQKNQIRYHQPTQNYRDTANIYIQTKINLNITSLQFDRAVINRVIDVASVGGFVLTDWKADLSKLTSVSQEISYRNIDELNAKIDYYLSHDQERLEIANTLHQDIKKHCTYDHIVEIILSTVTQVSPSNSSEEKEIICLDLGCGKHKEKGFIGVDCFPHEQVDIIADLNERFPFADQSVDFIKAYDIIEHLPNRIHTMNELWRISKPDAILDIRVPSTDGRGAFQDPTHVSFWNTNSFLYYCQEFSAYWELCKTYGFQGAFNLINLEEEKSELEVIHVHVQLQAIKLPSHNVLEKLNLREINFIVFPDWKQSIDLIFNDLVRVIQAIFVHPQKSKITLLIDTQMINLEDAEFLLGDILMSLYSEDIEIDEEKTPRFSLLNLPSLDSYETLLPFLYSRIVLEWENTELISQIPFHNLPTLTLEEFDRNSLKLFN